MQGKQPQEWIDSWKEEKDTVNDDFILALAGMRAEKLEKSCNDLCVERDLVCSFLADKEEKIKQLTNSLAQKEKELKDSQGKVGEISDEAVRAFLPSRAFEAAALTTAGVEIRKVLYGVVGSLNYHWPVKYFLVEDEDRRLLDIIALGEKAETEEAKKKRKRSE